MVEVRGVKIGGPELVLVGGPCGVESREQLFTVARYVAEAGVKLLRAGATGIIEYQLKKVLN